MSNIDPTIGDVITSNSIQFDFSFTQMISSLVVISILLSIILIINNRLQRRRLSQRVEQKRHNVLQGVALIRQQLESCSMSFEELLTIGQYSLSIIQNKLRDRSLRPIEILRAFQYKALLLYDAGNSGICQFIEEAEEMVESIELDLDRLLDLYPLAGIPISVKESCGVKGYDAVFGLAKLCGHSCKADSILIQVLKSCGVIPFLVTSGSFAGHDLTGYNPIFGDLGNPYNLSHCPAGSSTGECVLIAQSGSLIGMGKDRFGSIRAPAAMCGVVALKPSQTRVSSRGDLSVTYSTVFAIDTVYGPVANTVGVAADFMRSILNDELFRLDHRVIPIPFDEQLFNDNKKLTIGFYHTLKHTTNLSPLPSVKYAVHRAVNYLHHQGHTLVPFQPPNIGMSYKLMIRCSRAGGRSETLHRLVYEPLNYPNFFSSLLSSLPVFASNPVIILRDIVKALMRLDFGRAWELVTTIDAFNLLQDLELHRKAFEEAWKLAKLDAVICPFSPGPAPSKSVDPKVFSGVYIYAALYNLIDFSVGVLPFGRVDEKSLVYSETKENEKSKISLLQQFIEEHERDCMGLPVALQIAAPPNSEELVLRLMRELEQVNLEAIEMK